MVFDDLLLILQLLKHSFIASSHFLDKSVPLLASDQRDRPKFLSFFHISLLAFVFDCFFGSFFEELIVSLVFNFSEGLSSRLGVVSSTLLVLHSLVRVLQFDVTEERVVVVVVDVGVQRQERHHCAVNLEGSTFERNAIRPKWACRLRRPISRLLSNQVGVATSVVIDVHRCSVRVKIHRH